MKQFNANAFYNSFDITIKALKDSERITKDALRSLSRECLMLVHYESNKKGDISPVNQVLNVLTPRNRSTWILFFKEFSGFHFDKTKEEFTNKDKKIYEERFLLACEMLDDAAWDIWKWAKDNMQDRVKRPALEVLASSVEKALNAKDKETGIKLYKPSDIIKTIMEHGISADDIIELLQVMDIVDVA